MEPKEIMEAVNALKDTIKSYGVDSGEAKSRIEKISVTLDKQDAENQKSVLALKAAENKAIELENRLKELELEVSKKSESSSDFKDSVEYKALNDFIKTGEVKSGLRLDSNVDGGAIAPVQLDNRMLEAIEEISVYRQTADVMRVSKKTLEIPKITGGLVATFVGEAQDGTNDSLTFGNETITAYCQTVSVRVTNDILMDSAFDIESLVNRKVVQAFAKGEGTGITTGSAVPGFGGITTNATLLADVYTTGTSGELKYSDILGVTGELKTGYNPAFFLNRKTLAIVRAMLTPDNSLAWQVSLREGKPNTIAGEPYYVIPDLANVAANAIALFYGDLREGYRIIDRQGMNIVRDIYTYKKSNQIELTFSRFLSGKVVMPEAIKLIKIKA